MIKPKKRKSGRPSKYGFDWIGVGNEMKKSGQDDDLERIRKAVLEYGRRSGKIFNTNKVDGELTIARVE